MVPLVWTAERPIVQVVALEHVGGVVEGGPWFSAVADRSRFVVTAPVRPTEPLSIAVSCDSPNAWVLVDGQRLARAEVVGPWWCDVEVLPIPAEAWDDGEIQVEIHFRPSWAWSVVGDLHVGPSASVGAVAEARLWQAAALHRMMVAGWIGWLVVALGHGIVGLRMRDRVSLAYGVGLGAMATGELANEAYFAVLGPWVSLVVALLGNVVGTIVLTYALAVFFGLRRGVVATAVMLELVGCLPGGIPVMMAGWLLVGAASLTVGVGGRRAETGWFALALVLVFPYNLWMLLLSLGFPVQDSLAETRWLYVLTPPLTGTAMLVHRHLATWRSAQRFVPHDFLQALGHTDLAELAYGEQIERTMVIWFSDVRGFTTMLEGLAPAQVQPLLELSLGTQEEVIRRHGGFVDKYIGDAVMALFDDADAAVAAALEARREVTRRSDGRLAVGIGLHRGSVLLGTVGTANRMDCTVVGDAVNLASRVEGTTKRYGAAVLVTGAVIDALRERVPNRPVERVVVKGRTEPVALFEPLDPTLDAARLAAAAPLAEARQRLDDGDAVGAAPLLRSLATTYPEDGVIARVSERCERWLRDGVPDRPDVVILLEK